MLLSEMRSEGGSIDLNPPASQVAAQAQNQRAAISQNSIHEYFLAREGASTDQLIEEFMVYFQYLIR